MTSYMTSLKSITISARCQSAIGVSWIADDEGQDEMAMGVGGPIVDRQAVAALHICPQIV